MARTFSPAEYIGSLEASIRSPESSAPALGSALVSAGSLNQLGWTPRAVLVEPVVAPANNSQYYAADRTWKSIPEVTASSIQSALGYTPANRAGDTFSGPVVVNSTTRFNDWTTWPSIMAVGGGYQAVMARDLAWQWNPTNVTTGGTADLGFRRAGPNVFEVNNGTAGTLGTVRAAQLHNPNGQLTLKADAGGILASFQYGSNEPFRVNLNTVQMARNIPLRWIDTDNFAGGPSRVSLLPSTTQSSTLRVLGSDDTALGTIQAASLTGNQSIGYPRTVVDLQVGGYEVIKASVVGGVGAIWEASSAFGGLSIRNDTTTIADSSGQEIARFSNVGGFRSIATVPTAIPILARGAASQSANLQEWRNSLNETLASVSSLGVLTANAAVFNGSINGLSVSRINAERVAIGSELNPTVLTFIGGNANFSGAINLPFSTEGNIGQIFMNGVGGLDILNTRTLGTGDVRIGSAIGEVQLVNGLTQTPRVVVRPNGTTRFIANGTGMVPTMLVSDDSSSVGGMIYLEWRSGQVNGKIKGICADMNGLSFYRMNDAGNGFVNTTPDLLINNAGQVVSAAQTINLATENSFLLTHTGDPGIVFNSNTQANRAWKIKMSATDLCFQTATTKPFGGTITSPLVLSAAGNATFSGSVQSDSLTLVGTTPNQTELSISGYSLTGSNSQPMVSMAGTWNTTWNPTLIDANVTDTASAGSSLLLNLRRNGNAVFSVRKDGQLYVRNNILLDNGFTLTTPNSDAQVVLFNAAVQVWATNGLIIGNGGPRLTNTSGTLNIQNGATVVATVDSSGAATFSGQLSVNMATANGNNLATIRNSTIAVGGTMYASNTGNNAFSVGGNLGARGCLHGNSAWPAIAVMDTQTYIGPNAHSAAFASGSALTVGGAATFRNSGSGSSDFAAINLANNTVNPGQIFLTSSTYFAPSTLLIGARAMGIYHGGSGGLSIISDGPGGSILLARDLNIATVEIPSTGNVNFRNIIGQGFNSVTPSARFRMLASGQRVSEVGDGAGVWQSGYREEYNAGGIRSSIFGKTPIAQQVAPAVATDLASAITAVNSVVTSLQAFGLYV